MDDSRLPKNTFHGVFSDPKTRRNLRKTVSRMEEALKKMHFRNWKEPLKIEPDGD